MKIELSEMEAIRKSCLGILNRAKAKYLSEESTTESRNRYLNIIGNSALLALAMGDDHFEDFISWLRETRKELQQMDE